VVEFGDSVDQSAQESIVAVVSGWDPGLFGHGPVRIDCLPGGANNRNYCLEGPGTKLALRIASPSDRLAVDRASAIQAQLDAAAVDVAPELLAFRLPEGHTLSKFLDGIVLPWESLTDARVVREVARLLSRLHGARSTSRAFSPFAEIRHWIALARTDSTTFADDIAGLLGRVERIQQTLMDAGLPQVFCHNDTVPQNFIRCPDGVRLVDWDFAGHGWAAFELAAFCNTADLTPDLREEVFLAYSGGASDAQRATVALLSFVAAMREVAWAYMAKPMLEGTTTLLEGWTYDGFLSSNLDRARGLQGSDGFDELLERAVRGYDRQW
jgi:thiamine kinase-like enzyme